MKAASFTSICDKVILDLDSPQDEPERWALLRRLGHRKEVLDLPPYPLPPKKWWPRMKRIQLLTLRGRDVHHTEKNVPGGCPANELLPWFAGG